MKKPALELDVEYTGISMGTSKKFTFMPVDFIKYDDKMYYVCRYRYSGNKWNNQIWELKVGEEEAFKVRKVTKLDKALL